METLQAVEKIKLAPADENLRITRRIEIGHAIQQGDVYLHRVEPAHPKGKQIGQGLVQIALGTGNGARHMAEGEILAFEGKQLPEWVKAPMDVPGQEIMGLVIVAEETWKLTHPEHPHHRLPAGTYQTTYQYDPKTMRRVVD